MLPELKGGELLRTPQGMIYRVHKIRKPRRDTGFDEPLYRLERTVIGNKEWTLDELNAQCLTLMELTTEK